LLVKATRVLLAAVIITGLFSVQLAKANHTTMPTKVQLAKANHTTMPTKVQLAKANHTTMPTKVQLAKANHTTMPTKVQLAKANHTTMPTNNTQSITIDDRDLLQADATIMAGILILLTISSIKDEANLTLSSLFVLVPFAISAIILLSGGILTTYSNVQFLRFLSRVFAIFGVINLTIILAILFKVAKYLQIRFEKPSLVFDGYSKIGQPQITGSVPSVRDVFYVKVKNENEKSQGLAEDCAGNIIFRDTPYRTMWRDNRARHHSFGNEALKLFDIHNGILKFIQLIGEDTLDHTPDFPYTAICLEYITVKLESKKGHCPSPHSVKIEDIIKGAKPLYEV
jgi:hypothetical protein